jgi:hypothetical protein
MAEGKYVAQAIIAVGNAFDGLTIYGPFADMARAIDWAERVRLQDWRAVNLHWPYTLGALARATDETEDASDEGR